MPRVPKPSAKPLSVRWFLFFTVLFAAQVVPRFWSDSIMTDEPLKVADGYYYWTRGDVLSNIHQAPFASALQCLPVLLTRPSPVPFPTPDSSNRAFAFFYITNFKLLDSIVPLSRLVSLLEGLGIGLLLFMVTRFGSPGFCLSALCLWAFEPNLLAFSGTSISDIQVAFFSFAAVLGFQKALKTDQRRWILGTGLLTGMAVLSKFSALVLIPVFLVLEALGYYSDRKKPKFGLFLKALAVRWVWATSAFFFFVFIVYLPATIHLPDHRQPFHYFADALDQIVLHGESPWPSYYMGKLSYDRYWSYYPVTFLLKVAVPFSLLLFLGIFLAVRKSIQIPAWQWVPPLLILFSLLRVIDLGIRYLLPAFPFAILIAASAFDCLWGAKKKDHRLKLKIAAVGLLLWNAASVAAHYPRYLSYFNDLVPEDKELFLLGDSNLDFDQDLKRLAETAQLRHWPKVRLAYSGSTPPSVYGLQWRRWTQRDLIGPQPGNVYAVNAGFLQVAPAFFPQILPITQSWLTRNRPSGKVADTWYYFEFPGKPPKDDTPELPSVPVLRH